jgi:hypothetical protein
MASPTNKTPSIHMMNARNKPQAPWHTRIGRWFVRVGADPNACITAFATLAIAGLTVALVCVTRAQNRLEQAVERPWIYADFSVGSPLILRQDNRPPRMEIDLTYKNSGHSVATMVQPYFQFFTIQHSPNEFFDKQTRLCKPIRKQGSYNPAGIGTTVFPDQVVSGSGWIVNFDWKPPPKVPQGSCILRWWSVVSTINS